MISRVRPNEAARPWVLLTAAMVMLVGCASARPAADDRTGGVTLGIRMQDRDGGAAALYDVARDGTLGYGGGIDAQFDRVAWRGAMTDEEIARLLRIIDDGGWFEASPEGSGEPEGLAHRVELRGPGGSRRFTVRGRCESVEAAVALLDDIARRRFEPFMRTLPQPGERN